MPLVMDKSKSKKGASEVQYQRNMPYLIEVQCDISDLPSLEIRICFLFYIRRIINIK